MGILSDDEIRKLYEAAIAGNLGQSRDVLLAFIDKRFTVELPVHESPSDQIFSDLAALNGAGASANGPLPLATWLENAIELSGPRAESDVFKDALARVNERGGDNKGEGALFEGPDAVPALEVPHFTGRVEELEELRRWLAEPDPVCVVVTGLGGVGKTAVVQQFVATMAPVLFPDGAAWLDGAQMPSELARVAARFGWHDARPPTAEQAVRWLCNELHERPVLLVVDNVDPARVDLRQIPIPGGRCRTVLTSRSTTLHEALGRPARALILGQWDIATSRAYLRSVVPDLTKVADTDVDALTAFVAGLPLAVRLVARMLLRPGATVASVLARLSAQPLEALESVATGADRGVAATFQAAFQDLDDVHRDVLLALAACAQRTRSEVVAAVATMSDPTTVETLSDLAERSLASVTTGAERPWSLHDVLRLYVSHQRGFADIGARHLAFANSHAKAHGDPADWQAMERDIVEVFAALDRLIASGDAAAGIGLFLSMTEYLERRGPYEELVDAGLKLAALSSHDAGLAGLHAVLGHALTRMGRTKESIEHAEAALALYREAGDKRGQVVALRDIGDRYRMLGQLSDALERYQRALDLADAMGDPRFAAEQLRNVGNCLWMQGNADAALDHFDRSLSMLEELSDVRGPVFEDPATTIWSYSSVFAPSRATPEEVKRIMSIVARMDAFAERLHDPEARANSLRYAAMCHEVACDFAGALASYREAIAVATEVGDRATEASSTAGVGRCLLNRGDNDGALRAVLRAREIAGDLGELDLEGDCETVLGLIHAAAGAKELARAAFLSARELFRRVGKAETHLDLRRISDLLSGLDK